MPFVLSFPITGRVKNNLYHYLALALALYLDKEQELQIQETYRLGKYQKTEAISIRKILILWGKIP